MMKTMRMPKGWTMYGTNDLGFGSTETREERIRREQKFRNVIRNLETKDEENMKAEAEKLFDERNADNAQLLQAFKNKKLKSKTLIKKAKNLKKKEKKAAEAKVVTA